MFKKKHGYFSIDIGIIFIFYYFSFYDTLKKRKHKMRAYFWIRLFLIILKTKTK